MLQICLENVRLRIIQTARDKHRQKNNAANAEARTDFMYEKETASKDTERDGGWAQEMSSLAWLHLHILLRIVARLPANRKMRHIG